MRGSQIFFILTVVVLFSFRMADTELFEFKYPKAENAAVSFKAAHFKKFSQEWRGEDLYFLSEADGFTCSVLFYKLTEEEKASLVDVPRVAVNGPDNSPAYPYAYFKNYSKLKSMEKNDSSWGKPTDDFMFRQNDIVVESAHFTQKHMYGYTMLDKDIFVNVHLSKTGCTPADSTELMGMLQSLIKTK
ncbi:MAG: hypothetical protein QM791_11175 [Ferruginibacter sp.]